MRPADFFVDEETVVVEDDFSFDPPEGRRDTSTRNSSIRRASVDAPMRISPPHRQVRAKCSADADELSFPRYAIRDRLTWLDPQDRMPGGTAPPFRRRGYCLLVVADEKTRREIRALVDATYEAMSTPGSDVAAIFAADEITIAGSGLGELWSGPDEVVAAATVVSSWGFRWTAEEVTVWRRGEVAWAQILGSVRVVRDGNEELVPYWTTGVFGLDGGTWRWLYWGGSEPQEPAKV